MALAEVAQHSAENMASRTIDAFRAPANIAREIRNAATATGADFAYMMAKARIESSFRPDLQARTSSATGLYQFTEQTWLEMMHKYGADHGYADEAAQITRTESGRFSVNGEAERQAILDLRRDPRAASRLAGEFAAENRNRLETALGRSADSTEMYLAHFLGAGGALRFINAHEAQPQQNGADILPRAAEANRPIFYDPATGQPRSLDDIRNLFTERLGLEGTSQPETPAMMAASIPAEAPAAMPSAETLSHPLAQTRTGTPMPFSGYSGFAFTSPAAGTTLSLNMILALGHIEDTVNEIIGQALDPAHRQSV